MLSWGIVGNRSSMFCGEVFDLCASSVRNLAEADVRIRDNGIGSDMFRVERLDRLVQYDR